ncbi:SCO7613 C-terminal domain-containing membrane protein [Streptomyces triticagri]
MHTVRRGIRGTASAAACGTGAAGLAIAVFLSADAGTAPAAVGPGVLLVAAAAFGLHAASRFASTAPAVALSVVAGGALVLAPAGAVSAALPTGWAVPAHLLCAVGVLALWFAPLPLALRQGLALASGVVQAWSLLWALPSVSAALSAPATQLDSVWSGSWSDAGYTTGAGPAAPVCLAVVAAVLLAARRHFEPPAPDRSATTSAAAANTRTAQAGSTEPEAPTARPTGTTAATVLPWRTASVCCALVLAWSAGTAATAAFDLSHRAALAAHVALALTLLALAAVPARLAASKPPPDTQHPAPPRTALSTTATVLACASAVSATFLGLATRPATCATLGVLLAGFLAAAAVHPEGRGRRVPACGAVVCATALSVAVPASLGAPRHTIAVLLLVVPAATAAIGHRLRALGPAAPVELTGAGAGLLGVALAADDAPHLALTLALAGVIATATALRPERRGVRHLAAVLLVLACWVRLAAWDVGTPEAYTLPVTVPALIVGFLQRRRSPEVSSWTAYGPGLATTLLPSLAVVWSDPAWQRPLLLGTAALAVTLFGARHGLQAPLTLGAATVGLVGLHELAPYLAELVGALPRWLPPALAGLLLLALGATYEHRLRDARRLRDLLGRMH